MAHGADGSPAEESVGSGRVTAPGNPPASQREKLGRRLEVLATKLTNTNERLAEDWPKEGEQEEQVANFWRNGLEEVKNGVVSCQRLERKCRAVIQGDKGQPLPYVARKQLDEAMRQFRTAIRLARRDTLAAIHALEGRQRPTTRSDLYDRAVDQLAELSERCAGLATQMCGEKGLPPARPPVTPEAGGPH